jgi:hypothetical protein
VIGAWGSRRKIADGCRIVFGFHAQATTRYSVNRPLNARSGSVLPRILNLPPVDGAGPTDLMPSCRKDVDENEAQTRPRPIWDARSHAFAPDRST